MTLKLRILLIVGVLTALVLPAAPVAALTVQGPQTFIVELTPTTVTYASGATAYGSGTTTAYNTSTRAGVSTLFIRGDNKIFIDESLAGTTFNYNPSSGATLTALDSQNAIRNIADLGPYGTLQIIGVTPVPATLVGGVYSGVTLEVGYYFTTLKTAEEGRANSWLAAERIPIWRGAYNSGDSLWAQSFQFPAGVADARFYVRAGTAGIGALRAKLTLGLPKEHWQPPPLMLIGAGYFDQPASGTGVSKFAAIAAGFDGVRYGEFSLNSGTSAFVTADGLTTPANTGIGMNVEANKGFSKTGNEIRNLWFSPAIIARRWYYELFNAKP